MELNVMEASMTHSEEEGYLGRVIFKLPEQNSAYEITLQSSKGRDWNYSLSFAKESGTEEEFYAVEERLEEDDDLFEALVDVAMNSLAE